MHLFITVNFRKVQTTLKHVDGFIDQNIENSLLLVVDNSPENQELEEAIKVINNNVIYYRNNENLGYFHGAFKGLNYIARKLHKTHLQSLVILNNDIGYNDLSRYTAEIDLANNSNVGVIAPIINNAKKKINQNPFLIDRPGKSRYLLFKWLYASCALSKIIIHLKRYISTPNLQVVVNTPHHSKIYANQGAVFIFTKKFIYSNYKVEEIPIFYTEEISVAEHCIENNLIVRTSNNLFFEHEDHGTFSTIDYKKRCGYVKQSIAYILKKYY